ncbi:AbfB domain-containing protein, partial [Streptomyces sp. 2MCAF27]
TDKADATWIVRAGLANTSCLSFESVDKPGQFLRHYNYQLNLNFDDGGSNFAKDATFCPTAGNSGVGTSFQSVNFLTKYLRHYNYTVYIASNGGSNAWDSTTSWAQDTSWLTAAPWN